MMRLKSRRFSSKRVGILSTLILVLALAIQPLSPMVMRIAHASLDPAETTPSSPSLGSLAPVLWDGDNYKGINIDLSLKDITGLSSFTATIHREDDSQVVKTMKQDRIDWVNSRNGAATSLTIPFVVQAPSYDESTSGSWSSPSTTIWTSASVPQSVTVDMTFTDSSKNFTKTSPINTRRIDYLSLLPVSSNLHTTIVAPTDIVGNKFTVRGLATDDEALNRVYVQLVYRGDSQRYGGKTINLIGKGVKADGKGAEAKWSHEFDAVKLNLSDGQYAAHAQAVDMKGNRYDTGWTTNFTVDRTGPAISNVTPATGTSVKSDFTVSANVSDPRGVKKIALYVYDQATNTKVKEYSLSNTELSNTEGDTWATQVKLADLRGDAVYDLRFRAVDNLNNVTYHNNRGGAYLVNVDRTLPTASISVSNENPKAGEAVTVTGSVTNEDNIKSHWFEILQPDGKTTFHRYNMNSRDDSFSFEIKDLKSGVYRIRYVATDRAGNRNDDSNYKNSKILYLNVSEDPVVEPENPEDSVDPADGEDQGGGTSGDIGDNRSSQPSRSSTVVPISPVVTNPVGAFAGLGFGFTPATNVVQPEADDEEVLAEEDNRLESERGSVLNEADNAMEDADKEQTSGFMKFLGDWWWLILLGILTLGLLWWFIAWRRRKDEEEQ